MAGFHAYAASQQGQLPSVDQEHEQQLDLQFAASRAGGLYDRDSEVVEVLSGVRATAPTYDTSDAPDASPSPEPSPSRGRARPRRGRESSASGHGTAAAAGPPGQPTLERASAVSVGNTMETRSMGSSAELEEAVQVKRPEDDQPLRRFVTRSSSLSKEDFERLLQSQGLFNVCAASGLDPRVAKSHLPPSKLEPPSLQHVGRERRRRRSYSILRLPMARPDDAWVIFWSSLVLLSDLTYSAFIVPISIGMWTSFYEANWTTISDFLFGAVFAGDIFLSLHIGFIATYNTRKLLVMNGRIVASHYLVSFSFFVDLCATTAWVAQIVMVILFHVIDEFNPHTALVVMEGIRLLRFLRVVRLLAQLVSSGVYASLIFESPYLKLLRNQTFLSLCYLMYMIAVVVNFLGCLWNFTAGAEGWNNSWVNYYPPFVRSYAVSPDAFFLTSDEAREVSKPWLWLVGNYWALTTVATVGYGDVVAASSTEVAVAMGVEIVGVLFFGLIISSVSELLQQANRKARRVNVFRSKMQSVERWMQQQGLPHRLKRRIKTFYAEVWIRQHESKEETVLFQELPHSLRNEVAWQACQHKLRRIPLLAELDDKALYLLASKMTPFRFGPGHDLVIEGDPGDRFWILVEGEVVALYHYREAERLEGPAVVGESVLLQEHEEALRSYPCTYRTLTSCSCWMVRCRDFKPMLRPAVQRLVKARALQGLADRMHRYPQMWEGKALRRLHAGAADAMQRAASDAGPLAEGPGEDASVQATAAGAAAIRSRLARGSAPVPGPHHRAISWGGEQAGGSSPHPGAQGGGEQEAADDGGASHRRADAAGGAAAGAAASDRQQQEEQEQEQEQGLMSSVFASEPPGTLWPGLPLSGGMAAARQRSAALAPLTEGQPMDVAALHAEDAAGAAPAARAPVRSGSPAALPALPAEGVAGLQANEVADDEPLSSVMVVEEQGPMLDRSSLAAAAAAAAGHRLATAGQGLAALARLMRPSARGPAGGGDAGSEDDEALEEAGRRAAGDGVLDEAMLRLPTTHALAMLEAAAAARAREEAAVAADPGAAAEQQAALLGAVLGELQALRRDVDSLRPRPVAPP